MFGAVPAAAGTAPSSPPASLSASPSRVRVDAGGHSTLRVTNSGARAVIVAAAPAGYSLDLRGRPRIARGRVAGGSAPWIEVRPATFALAPGGTASLAVTAAAPKHASPGDHAALILLSTRPTTVGRVAVALRVGVVVDVRVPGVVVRRLVLGAVRVRRLPHGRAIEVVVANHGNVSELLRPGRLRVELRRGGRRLVTLRPQGQELLPRTTGVVGVLYRGPARGRVSAVIELATGAARTPERRTVPIRL